MGATKTNIAALLMKYVLVNGEWNDEFVELAIENPHQLAPKLGVEYSALTRNLQNESLFEYNKEAETVRVYL